MALERADGRDNGAVQVGVGSGDDAAGERRGIHAVLGQQHQIYIDRLDRGLIGRASDHIDKIRGQRKIFTRCNDILALADANPCGRRS